MNYNTYEGRSKITLTFAVTSTWVVQFKKKKYHDTSEHLLIEISLTVKQLQILQVSSTRRAILKPW